MSLLRRLYRWLCDTPVIDFVAPDDPPEPRDTRERRRLHALSEIHRCTADNLVFYDFKRGKS